MPEQKTKRVYITVPEAMTRLANQDYAILRGGVREVRQASYNTFIIPPKTRIDDLDLSYGTVINQFATPNADGTVTFPFLADRSVSVSVQARDEEGNFLRDEEGRPVFERHDVDPRELKAAVDQCEYLTIHRAFVQRGIPYTDKEGVARTFNSVSLPEGVKVGDNDLSHGQFSPFHVMRGYRTEEVDIVPLLKDRAVRVTLASEEDGHMVHDKDNFVEVSPHDLNVAIANQRKAYVEARKAAQGPTGDAVVDGESQDIEQAVAPQVRR